MKTRHFWLAALLCAGCGSLAARAVETNAPAAVSARDAARSFALYQAGLALQNGKNDLDGAVAKYEEALRINPANADCLNHYAWFLAVDAPAGRKQVDRGIELALRAVQASEGMRPDILDTLAEAYFQKGDLARAAKIGRQAVRVQQESGSPKYQNYLQRQLAKFEQAAQGKKP
jgi:tetratricopeptide (TPR) repeat protein